MDEREFTELKIKLDYLLQELTQIKQEMRKLIELSEKQISMSKDIELLHEKVITHLHLCSPHVSYGFFVIFKMSYEGFTGWGEGEYAFL